MSTQHYLPQQQYAPPPAPPSGRPPKFVATPGARHVVTLTSVPGRLVPSTFGVSEVVFDVDGGRPWYVPQVIADEIYRLGVVSGDQVEVTATGKKKTDLLIVPLQSRFQARGPQASQPVRPVNSAGSAVAAALPVAITPVTAAHSTNTETNGSAPRRTGEVTPASLRFMGAYKDAIDVLLESKQYAQSRGLALEIHCEDVRCLAATIMIDLQRGGTR